MTLYQLAQKHRAELNKYELEFIENNVSNFNDPRQMWSPKQRDMLRKVKNKLTVIEKTAAAKAEKLKKGECTNCNGSTWEMWMNFDTGAKFARRCTCSGGPAWLAQHLESDGKFAEAEAVREMEFTKDGPGWGRSENRSFKPKEIVSRPVQAPVEDAPDEYQGDTETLETPNKDHSDTLELGDLL